MAREDRELEELERQRAEFIEKQIAVAEGTTIPIQAASRSGANSAVSMTEGMADDPDEWDLNVHDVGAKWQAKGRADGPGDHERVEDFTLAELQICGGTPHLLSTIRLCVDGPNPTSIEPSAWTWHACAQRFSSALALQLRMATLLQNSLAVCLSLKCCRVTLYLSASLIRWLISVLQPRPKAPCERKADSRTRLRITRFPRSVA